MRVLPSGSLSQIHRQNVLSTYLDKADADSVIKWTVGGQLSWHYLRVQTLHRWSSSQVIIKLSTDYSTTLSRRSISESCSLRLRKKPCRGYYATSTGDKCYVLPCCRLSGCGLFNRSSITASNYWSTYRFIVWRARTKSLYLYLNISHTVRIHQHLQLQIRTYNILLGRFRNLVVIHEVAEYLRLAL